MYGFQGAGGRPSSRFDGQGQINITPFIDVVLVLLIIFMVVAPLSTVDVPLDLPKSTATPATTDEKPVIVSVQSDLSLHVGDAAVAPQGLPEALAAAGAKPDTRILLRADRKIAYGDLMTTFDTLRQAGFTKVALVGLDPGDR